jgi:hypothetical protein
MPRRRAAHRLSSGSTARDGPGPAKRGLGIGQTEQFAAFTVGAGGGHAASRRSGRGSVSSTSTPLPQELARHKIEIKAPLRVQVLQRYLRRADLPISETSKPSAVLSEFLSRNRPIREITELAELIVDASKGHHSPDGFPRWCELACAAATDRTQEVAKLLETKFRKGPQRALLLVTAMLHEAHADAVHHGTTALLEAVCHPQDKRPLPAPPSFRPSGVPAAPRPRDGADGSRGGIRLAGNGGRRPETDVTAIQEVVRNP